MFKHLFLSAGIIVYIVKEQTQFTLKYFMDKTFIILSQRVKFNGAVKDPTKHLFSFPYSLQSNLWTRRKMFLSFTRLSCASTSWLVCLFESHVIIKEVI